MDGHALRQNSFSLATNSTWRLTPSLASTLLIWARTVPTATFLCSAMASVDCPRASCNAISVSAEVKPYTPCSSAALRASPPREPRATTTTRGADENSSAADGSAITSSTIGRLQIVGSAHDDRRYGGCARLYQAARCFHDRIVQCFVFVIPECMQEAIAKRETVLAAQDFFGGRRECLHGTGAPAHECGNRQGLERTANQRGAVAFQCDLHSHGRAHVRCKRREHVALLGADVTLALRAQHGQADQQIVLPLERRQADVRNIPGPRELVVVRMDRVLFRREEIAFGHHSEHGRSHARIDARIDRGIADAALGRRGMNTRIDIRHDIDRDNSIAADRDQLAGARPGGRCKSFEGAVPTAVIHCCAIKLICNGQPLLVGLKHS